MDRVNLFDGEELEIEEGILERSEDVSDTELNERYVEGEVRIVTEKARYPLPSIPDMVESEEYELQPEFQRRHRWDRSKQSRLIESFIMNVPIPPIFLYEKGYAEYEVMDGLQRLTAIKEFYRDELQLEGLEKWPELNGCRYSTLPGKIRKGVDRRYLSSIILLQETADTDEEAQRLKQLVFERINSGGVDLTPQESRNAIYDGPLNKLCIDLARNPHLCNTWGIPKPSDVDSTEGDVPRELQENNTFRKMKDVELVLRFFAYRQRLDHSEGRLRDFLDQYLKKGNLFDEDTLSNLRTLFEKTIELADNLFGPSAFWMYRHRKRTGWGWYHRPTTTVYDPLMFVLSQNLHRKEALLEKEDKLYEGRKLLYKEREDDFKGRRTNISDLKKRNDIFDSFIDSIV